MTKVLLIPTMAVMIAAPTLAFAQSDAPPPPPQDARQYQGQDGYYEQDCRKSSGTTGTVAGAGVGGVGAAVLGASPLGIAAGVVGGGLLGRHLDKKHDEAQNRKNGC